MSNFWLNLWREYYKTVMEVVCLYKLNSWIREKEDKSTRDRRKHLFQTNLDFTYSIRGFRSYVVYIGIMLMILPGWFRGCDHLREHEREPMVVTRLRQGAVLLDWWVLISTCKQLVWSNRIGRNMPIWILCLILGSVPGVVLPLEETRCGWESCSIQGSWATLGRCIYYLSSSS